MFECGAGKGKKNLLMECHSDKMTTNVGEGSGLGQGLHEMADVMMNDFDPFLVKA